MGERIGAWRVIVVDDHRLMVEAVHAALADEPQFELVGGASSGDAALELARAEAPDIALVDLRMPGMSGLECIAALRRAQPHLVVVVLSGNDDPAVVRQALDAGASAFVSKLVDPRDIAATLRQVVEGTVVSPAPLHRRAESTPLADLTERELAVLRSVAAGAPNKEVGRLLYISEPTVKYHLGRIYAKLGVAGRVDAVRVALAENLIESETASRP